jgi:hypothetical protein
LRFQCNVLLLLLLLLRFITDRIARSRPRTPGEEVGQNLILVTPQVGSRNQQRPFTEPSNNCVYAPHIALHVDHVADVLCLRSKKLVNSCTINLCITMLYHVCTCVRSTAGGGLTHEHLVFICCFAGHHD